MSRCKLNLDLITKKYENQNDFYKINPNKGQKFNESDYCIRSKSGRINHLKLFKWMGNFNEDKLISTYKMSSLLKKLGINLQCYYDVVVLGLSDISERPKCMYEKCNNSTKFISFQNGYTKFCSRSCQAYVHLSEFKGEKHSKYGTHLSNEQKQKISKSETGTKKRPRTEEEKKFLSKLNKGRKITWKDKMRDAALNNIRKNPSKSLKNLNSNRKIGYFKPNKSEETIKYLSSWELKFMKMCDLSKDVIKIQSCEGIDYNFAGKDHIYIPDFKLTLSNGLIVIVEIKPYKLTNMPKIIAKRIAGKKWCNKNNYKYITLTEIELFKKVKGSFNIFDYIV